jgi:magnesium-transporting ATPase (P-type)
MKTLEKARFMIFMAICLISFVITICLPLIIEVIKLHGYKILVAFVVLCVLFIIISPFTNNKA